MSRITHVFEDSLNTSVHSSFATVPISLKLWIGKNLPNANIQLLEITSLPVFRNLKKQILAISYRFTEYRL